MPVENRLVSVPIALLLNPDLTASAKVAWMARRLLPDASPAALVAKTGVSRHTVERALALLAAMGPAPGGGARASVPAALLAEPKVGAQAKVLYGLLQTTPVFRGQGGEFTYTSLSAMTRLGRNTLRRAMAELAGAGLVSVSQRSRLSPVSFSLGRPALLRAQAEAAAALRRLKRARYGGEAIMQEYLSLLIDCDDFTDNARPGFLVNPQTGERLELDRFYPPDVAFEFHGAQHDRATDRFAQEQVDAQHFRDLIKAGLCVYRGIHLVIVRPEDLSLQGLLGKIGHRLPLRNLAGHEPLIGRLEEASLAYRASMPGR